MLDSIQTPDGSFQTFQGMSFPLKNTPNLTKGKKKKALLANKWETFIMVTATEMVNERREVKPQN